MGGLNLKATTRHQLKGEIFGQKERLVDRINDILKRYSGQFCLFKVNK